MHYSCTIMVMLDDRSESNVSLGDLDLTDFDVDVDVDGELDASSRHSLSIISGYGGGENHDSGATNNDANANAGADKKNKNAKQDYESSLYQATKSLLKWRSCILFVWILSSISVSLAAFFYLGHLEQEEFETSVSTVLYYTIVVLVKLVLKS